MDNLNAQPAILEVEKLSFRYPDGTQALYEVSLQVQARERVALIGANGSGKSTLLLHLNGIHRCQTGVVRINGFSVSDTTVGMIRAAVGLVFQDADDQLFSLQVFEDVAFGPLHMGLPKSEVKTRVENALAAVGIPNFANRMSHHLSVGEKKRVALATVLSMEPKILVLDEPSAGLDPRGRRQLIQLLQSFSEQTLLISTHDMRLANEVCSRTLVLDEGRVVADGLTREIIYNPVLMETHGLETPT